MLEVGAAGSHIPLGLWQDPGHGASGLKRGSEGYGGSLTFSSLHGAAAVVMK